MHKSKRPWFIVGALCAAILLAWTASPTQAHAQAGHIHGVRLDGHLGLGWYRAIGPGMRLDIALAPNGFIRSVDDEFALTFGVDLLFNSHYHRGHGRYGYYYDDRYYDDHHYDRRGNLMFLIPIAVQWNFILPHNWTVFPELGVALVHHYGDLDALPHVAFGARWHFSGDQVALLLRLAHPGAFQVGLTF